MTTINDRNNYHDKASSSLPAQENTNVQEEKEDYADEHLPSTLKENPVTDMFQESSNSNGQEEYEPEEHKIDAFAFLKLEYGSNSGKCKGVSIRNDLVQPEAVSPNVKKNDKPKKIYTCIYCDRIFSKRDDLKFHLLSHSKGKAYTCEYCNENFLYESLLNQHIIKHSKLKPFICDHCNSSFSHKFNLKRHLLKHSNVKPFSCEHCDKSFTHKSYLKEHLLIHSGDKPFPCKLCKMSFMRKSFLNVHLRTHFNKTNAAQKNIQSNEEMNNAKHEEEKDTDFEDFKPLSSRLSKDAANDMLQKILCSKEKEDEEIDENKINTFAFLELEYGNNSQTD